MIKSDSQSVVLNILYVYYSIRLQVVIPWSPGTVLRAGPRVLRFYTLFTQGACIAGQFGSVCLHYMVYLYYIGYACYVISLHHLDFLILKPSSFMEFMNYPITQCATDNI